MGQEIVYCPRCQTRLLAADFEKGAAVRVDTLAYCVRCLPEALKALPPAKVQAFLKQRAAAAAPSPAPERARSGKTTRIHTIAPVTPRHAFRAPARPSAARGALLAAAGAVLLVAILFVALSRPKPQTPAARTTPAAPPRPAPAIRSAQEEAVASLEAARRLAKERPSELEAHVALFELAVDDAADTPHFAEAKAGLARALERLRKTTAAELSDLDRAVEAARGREAFGEALALLDRAQPRYRRAEWTDEVGKRREAVEQRLDAVRRDVEAAARRESAAGLAKLRDRVRAWGLPDVERELAALLSPDVPPPPPSPAKSDPAEIQAYESAWRLAATRASVRKHAYAVKVLGDALRSIRARELRSQALAELRRFQQVLDLHRDALQTIADWPADRPLSVEVWDERGSPRRVEGRIARRHPDRLDILQSGKPVPVEIGELTPAALAALAPAAPPEARQFLFLLEGEADAAVKVPGAPPVSERHRAYSAQHRAAAAAAVEAEARARFHEARERYRDPVLRDDAVRGFASLHADFAQSLFVRRNRESLTDWTAGTPSRFFLAADLKAGGAFRRVDDRRVKPCWLSAVETPSPDTYVEVPFEGDAGRRYRTWIFAGACCAETFAFQVLAAGETAPRSASHGVTAGARTHASHGGPKQPSHWTWIELPRGTAPSGRGTVRIVPAQPGFAVGYAFVSAVDETPPAEASILAMRRPAPAPGPTPAPKPAGLAGHWRFDETSGASATDASGGGRPGTLERPGTWGPGRLGGALSFDGEKDAVTIPHAAALDLAGSFTVAAWIFNRAKVDPLPKGNSYRVIASKEWPTEADGSWAMAWNAIKGGVYFLVRKETGDAYVLIHAPFGDDVREQWHHVAAVFDKGTLTLHVDGVLRAGPRTLGTPRAFRNGKPLKIGDVVTPRDRWMGQIDDVRLYDRALPPEEIQALHASR